MPRAKPVPDTPLNKLYTIHFSTPYQELNEMVVESISLTDAKEMFQKIISLTQYLKVRYQDKDMIVLSDSIKIKKAALYKQV